jgi:hypothetical protein
MAAITRAVNVVDEARPKSSQIASRWKIGSARMTAAPIVAPGG